jgi:hypothetical protein
MVTTTLQAKDELFGAAYITINRVVRENGKLFAYFHSLSGDGGQWFMEVKPADLQSFRRFQAKALSQRGVWIGHSCEDCRSARLRAERWDDEVHDAFDRGARR